MSKKFSTRELLQSALFTALIAAFSYLIIPLPFSPVPVTAQTFAIMLCGLVLRTRQVALSVLTYIFIGLIGIPVFSGGTGGIGAVFGPKGGYIWGFLLGSLLISLLARRFRSFWGLVFAAFTGGVLIVYLCGVLWLARSMGLDLRAAVLGGALPFLPGDIFKVLAAAFTAQRLRQYLKRTIN